MDTNYTRMKRLLNGHALKRVAPLVLLANALLLRAAGEGVLFDFENAPLRSPLPISLTVGGITAQFSATGQGFSIQPANTMGFTPAGFSGNCIYPSSIYAADLIVSFSAPITAFSILYAPQELACDSSATMRVTAYLDAVPVGSATTNAQAGTWPSETLAFGSPQSFNKVVVHYDKPPVTGGDWGPIFMADNMSVTPAPPPIMIVSPTRSPEGWFQFSFTNTPSASFTVWASTNAALPFSNWTAVSGVVETAPGQFQFTDLQAATFLSRFYRVTSP